MRLITLPVLSQGRETGKGIDIAAAIPIVAMPEHLVWLGYRLTLTARGRLAVERLH